MTPATSLVLLRKNFPTLLKLTGATRMPNSLTERTCPSCDKVFKTIGGRNSHLKQARKCAWYNKQQFVFSDDSECEDEVLPQQDEDFAHNINDDEVSALPEEDDIIQLPDLGPNDTQPMVKRRKIDDSTMSHEYHPTAGKIFQIDKMAQSASTKYISPMSNDFYSPFVSEEDWKFAEWLIEEDIGKAAGDRLMSITKV